MCKPHHKGKHHHFYTSLPLQVWYLSCLVQSFWEHNRSVAAKEVLILYTLDFWKADNNHWWTQWKHMIVSPLYKITTWCNTPVTHPGPVWDSLFPKSSCPTGRFETVYFLNLPRPVSDSVFLKSASYNILNSHFPIFKYPGNNKRSINQIDTLVKSINLAEHHLA